MKPCRKGFSLLELLLALLILTMLTFVAVGQYRQHHKNKDIEILRHNIQLLKTISQLFYYHQCIYSRAPFLSRFESDAFNIEKIREKIPFQLLSTSLIKPSTLRDQQTIRLEGYEIYANLSGAPIYLPNQANAQTATIIWYPYYLTLKITFSDSLHPSALDGYQALFGASYRKENQLIWDYLPQESNHKNGRLWNLEPGLHQFRNRAMENLSAGKAQAPVLQCAY